MRNLFFAFACILFLYNQPVSWGITEDTEKESVAVSLHDCYLLALKNNVDIAFQKEDPLIREWEITNQRGIFDPLFSFDMNYTDKILPFPSLTRLSTGLQRSQSEELFFDSSLSGLLPTSTRYGIGYETLRTMGTTTLFENEYEGIVSFRLTQPLLKNMGNFAATYQITVAKINKNISDEELRATLIGILAEVQHKYWDLFFAIKDLEVRRESLILAQTLLNDNKERVKVGILPPIEITQAESGVALREESVIIGEQNVKNSENELKILLFSDPYDIIRKHIIPRDKPADENIELSFTGSLNTAIKNRPDYLIAKKKLDTFRVKARFLHNQLLPELNFVGKYNLHGIESDYHNTFDTIGSEDNREWIVGFELEVPLGNRSARSGYFIAKHEIKKQEFELRKIELQLVQETDNAIQNIKTNYKRVSATAVSQRLAEEALAAEIKKLENGTSTSHNVLEFQNELSVARFNAIRAIVDLKKSIIDLFKVEGTLLDKLSITVE